MSFGSGNLLQPLREGKIPPCPWRRLPTCQSTLTFNHITCTSARVRAAAHQSPRAAWIWPKCNDKAGCSTHGEGPPCSELHGVTEDSNARLNLYFLNYVTWSMIKVENILLCMLIHAIFNQNSKWLLCHYIRGWHCRSGHLRNNAFCWKKLCITIILFRAGTLINEARRGHWSECQFNWLKKPLEKSFENPLEIQIWFCDMSKLPIYCVFRV